MPLQIREEVPADIPSIEAVNIRNELVVLPDVVKPMFEVRAITVAIDDEVEFDIRCRRYRSGELPPRFTK